MKALHVIRGTGVLKCCPQRTPLRDWRARGERMGEGGGKWSRLFPFPHPRFPTPLTVYGSKVEFSRQRGVVVGG